MQDTQKTLAQAQIEAFYHDSFVKSQVSDFMALIGKYLSNDEGKIVDIGGGCGYFAKAIEAETGSKLRVVDTDLKSIDVCKRAGIEAIYGDALSPIIFGDESVICFNLILHHLVGGSDNETYKLQSCALKNWHDKAPAIFINEYIYESFVFKNFSGWLIYQITSNTFLSSIGKLISKLIPSLKANTFGIGVRFRSHSEWVNIFNLLGFDVVAVSFGKQERVSFSRRMLLIKNCRRDSFLLRPMKA